MDSTDWKLIDELQRNGRAPSSEIARKVGLAPSTTHERIRRLEERGVVLGYRAVLDPKRLGLEVQAMVLITLDRHQVESIDDFEDRVRAVAEVRTCFHVAGQYDYMLHVVVRNIDHLRELVRYKLAGIRGVEKQETFLVLSVVKEDQGYPLFPGENPGRKRTEGRSHG